jgi:hypothetical protein
MAAARAPLHLVDAAPATVEVPAALLAAAITNAGAIADDLEAGVDAIAQRLFAGSRAAAVNELGRMAVRIQSFRDDFAALDPSPSTPTRPRRVA